jgi:2-polyprenyl-3-methyl-5-hydroxy-6-metoxy-1,4-benzoquinol methylase
MPVYSKPLYYEIAFGFVDAVRQVDLFEEFIEKHSKIGVRRFLDIGCGPALQLREIAKRGYEVVGLDASHQMLDYLR